MVMHMHIKLMNTFLPWLISYHVSGGTLVTHKKQ